MKRPAISERVEIPGVRPATFKLVEREAESYNLFRSSRKLGTARLELDGQWTARFEGPDGRWTAGAESAAALLRLVGAYLLLGEAREAAARPIEEEHPELRVKGKKSPEEQLSIEFVRRARKARIAELDKLIEGLKQNLELTSPS